RSCLYILCLYKKFVQTGVRAIANPKDTAARVKISITAGFMFILFQNKDISTRDLSLNYTIFGTRKANLNLPAINRVDPVQDFPCISFPVIAPKNYCDNISAVFYGTDNQI